MRSIGHRILVKFLELAPSANPANIKSAKHKYVTKPLLRPKVPHISLTSISWLTSKEIKPAITYKPINTGIKGLFCKARSFPFRAYDKIRGVRVTKAICLGQLIGSRKDKEKTELTILRSKLIRK